MFLRGQALVSDFITFYNQNMLVLHFIHPYNVAIPFYTRLFRAWRDTGVALVVVVAASHHEWLGIESEAASSHGFISRKFTRIHQPHLLPAIGMYRPASCGHNRS